MTWPTDDDIKRQEALYPAGTRVRLLEMDDPAAPPIGMTGTVVGVDGIGSLLMDWDNGSRLNVAYPVDRVEIISTPENP